MSHAKPLSELLARVRQRAVQNALRQRWRAHWSEVGRILEDAEARGLLPGEYETPDFPDELRGLTCGAHSKRTGEPCRQKVIYSNGRCKFHGGASTGPITEAGKQQARENGRKGGRPRKTEADGEVRKRELHA